MNIACTIVSKQPIDNRWIPLNHYVHVQSDLEASPRGTIERVRLIADLRNKAVKQLLEKYPETTHVYMIDSYYLTERNWWNLCDFGLDYVRNLTHLHDSIVGISTWVKIRDDNIIPKIQFYDRATTPEAKQANLRNTGLVKVKAVGASYIFPIEAWQKNGYQCDNDKFVPEHVSLCKDFNTFIDFDYKIWRNDNEYRRPLAKILRVKLGQYRRNIHV